VPLLHAGGHLIALAELDERLTYAHQLEGPLQAESLAIVALGAGRPQRALVLFTQAAAESPDPRSVWARVVEHGRRFGAAEVERRALRKLLLHTPGYDDPRARRRLLLARLRDASEDPNWGSDSQAGEAIRAAVATNVENHLAAFPRARRWREREELLRALEGVDERTRGLVEAAILGDDEVLRAAHRPRGITCEERSAGHACLDARAVATAEDDALVRARAQEEGPLAAIAVATTGPVSMRVAALARALSSAPPEQRARWIDVLVRTPAALEPSGGGYRVASLVPDGDTLLALTFGLRPPPSPK
jgi:hypothetical protein